ncbi:MAG: MBL fold metallo-hydrolase, partial [Candidatus Binatia bacterium]
MSGLVFFLLFFAACEKPLRLPYIVPELQNWPQPYKGIPGLRLHIFNTGTVELPAKLVYRGSSFLDTYTLDILVFVIEHPRQEFILFGTGLNRELVDDPEHYLGGFLNSLGSPEMAKGQDIRSQLKQAKLSDKKVRTLIMSDLRLDHAGELESFPLAQAIVTATEHTSATDQGGSLYLTKEYDNVPQWKFIDFAGAKPLGTLPAHQDLFGDGSVLLLDAAGATAGGLAVLVRLPAGPVILCGNLAWTEEHSRYARLPGLLFNRAAWWEKIWRLKKFKDLAPELVLLPDHDWTAVEAAKTKDIVLHPFKETLNEKSSQHGKT